MNIEEEYAVQPFCPLFTQETQTFIQPSLSYFKVKEKKQLRL